MRADVAVEQGLAGRSLGILVETRQGLFCCDPDDRYVTKQLLEHGAYGTAELERIGAFVGRASRVLAVGAHIGSLVVPLSRKVAEVVGVEANPRTFELLQLNLRINQCGNVRAFNLAASDRAGSLEFVANRTNTGASKRMPLVRNPLYFNDSPEVMTTPAVSLDDLLPDDRFDLVFMDIEGSEIFAMRGMPRLLSRATVVICEFYPFLVRDVGGADVEAFLAPLAEFQTLVVPTLNQQFHGSGIRAGLQGLWDRNHCEDGLIFVRDRREFTFV